MVEDEVDVAICCALLAGDNGSTSLDVSGGTFRGAEETYNVFLKLAYVVGFDNGVVFPKFVHGVGEVGGVGTDDGGFAEADGFDHV